MGPKKTITPQPIAPQPITSTSNETSAPVKAKRGRKSKQELMAALQLTNPISLTVTENLNDKSIDNSNDKISELTSTQQVDIQPQPIKKRGRKPKGGKIIQPTVSIDSYKEDKPNIILHLKCSLKDIDELIGNNVESFNFTKHDLGFDIYGSSNINVSNYTGGSGATAITNLEPIKMNNYEALTDDEDYDVINKDHTKEIWRKLKQLEHNLHINNVNNKKSCCFWDTCDFDGPSIYAPKYRRNGIIYVEGCFCCPQCAAAYIINKPNIDNSTRFECLYLLNYLYGSIFEYTKNINPAPDPRYMLSKFLGNLTIQQYRSLLGNERLFLIVDKPLTRVLPELHEYNDEFILNNKIIPSNNYQLKARLQKKKQDKNSILNEKFGINYGQMSE